LGIDFKGFRKMLREFDDDEVRKGREHKWGNDKLKSLGIPRYGADLWRDEDEPSKDADDGERLSQICLLPGGR